MNCPNCRSVTVQSIAEIHRLGTTVTKSEHSGSGLTIGTYRGETTSTTQSALAARFTPPKAPGGGMSVLNFSVYNFFLCLAIGIPTTLNGLWVIGLICAAWAVLIFFYARAYMPVERGEYNQQLSQYNSTMYCFNCLKTFQQNQQLPPSVPPRISPAELKQPNLSSSGPPPGIPQENWPNFKRWQDLGIPQEDWPEFKRWQALGISPEDWPEFKRWQASRRAK